MAHSATAETSAQTSAVTERVVTAVADFTDADPLDLEPLYSVVDPDALVALFEANGIGGSPSRVTFTYCGCEVEITSDGTVHVSESDRENGRLD